MRAVEPRGAPTSGPLPSVAPAGAPLPRTGAAASAPARALENAPAFADSPGLARAGLAPWRLPCIRPVQHGDREALRRFFETLSSRSRTQRFLAPVRALGDATLDRMTRFEPRRAVTLLAVVGERHDSPAAEQWIVGVAEYVADPWPARADFALAIADDWQGRGLGGRMLRALASRAREDGFRALEGDILTENRAMMSLVRASGHPVTWRGDDARVRRASLRLDDGVRPARLPTFGRWLAAAGDCEPCART